MTSPVSPSLPALRQLLNEAQPGWNIVGGTHDRQVIDDRGAFVCETYLVRDAELIVNAVGSLPALLDRLERQAAAIEAVQAEMRHWAKRCPEDDWGSGDIVDAVLADASRHVLSKIENHLSGITPTTEEKSTDER